MLLDEPPCTFRRHSPRHRAILLFPYRLLQDRLKGTTIISIGHRSTLGAFHRRRIEVVPGDAVSQVRDVPLVSAAE